jgi:DNA-binding transcriptional regulator YiaG
LGNVET